MTRIFISYRRAVSAYQAGRLFDRLVQAFGEETIFLDVDGIPAGENFDTYILQRIQQSDVFLALLSKGTLDRIHEPGDWVRQEIAYALSLPQVRVIPVLVDGFAMPAPDDLPADLRELTRRNAVHLNHGLFNETVNLLIQRIKTRDKASATALSSPALSGTRRRSSRSIMGVIGGLAALMLVVVLFVLPALKPVNRDATSTPTMTAPAVVQQDTTEPTDTATDDLATQTSAVTTTDIPTEIDTPTLNPRVTPIAHNDDWTPVEQDFDGVTMVLVPAGCFIMGSMDGDDDEQPVEQQCIETPFWLDKYEVTNEQFQKFGGVAESESRWNDANRPRERITWFEARDYCEQKRGGWLPTEKEWEYAARGPDNLIYPWGNDFVAENTVYKSNSGDLTAKTGSRRGGVSWIGAMDMSGNIYEWVNSLYLRYKYDIEKAEDKNDVNNPRVTRGGSWDNSKLGLRTAKRFSFIPNSTYGTVGFRCKRSQ